MNLSLKQVEAFDAIMLWLKDKSRKRFVLAGYAGTGKSTLARHLENVLGANNVFYCAYTGKAANVLREKGCEMVNTIHGYAYILDKNNSTESQPIFKRNPESPLKSAPIVIIDEYSMLPEKIIEDLEKSCNKILYLGDPFQLPPVSGECPLKPDFFLTEIHRQALDSPIIRYATMTQEGKLYGRVNEKGFKHITKRELAQETFFLVDQIIVGTNQTRKNINNWYRKRTIPDAPLIPQKGEKIICLKNNFQLGIFNGMIGESGNAFDVTPNTFKIPFEHLKSVNVWRGDVSGKGEYFYNKNAPLERFDFAYAITAHKSQGSEFKSLLIKNEPVGSDVNLRARWLYTAITRASENCILVS